METEQRQVVLLHLSLEKWNDLKKTIIENKERFTMREDFLWLMNLYNCEVGAEIGVFEGEHAEHILKYVPKLKKLYLVDAWKEYPDCVYADPANCRQEEFDKKLARVTEKFCNDGRVIIIHNESVRAVLEVKEELDFVYIDANHRYEFVASDILAWYQKVKKGGLVCGHDYNKPEVARAVEEFCRTTGLTPHWWGCLAESSWFFEK